MSVADESSPDFLEQTAAMQELLPYLRALVGDTAEITPENYWASDPDGQGSNDEAPSIRTVYVQPHNVAALTFEIICEQWIVVDLGQIGGRWELGYEDDDIAHAKRLVEAAVAGRVIETFALGRSRVTATFSDGTSETETGYEGCLTSLVVLPGWTRWGRTIQYEPYRAATQN
ncbi:hypothetical protein GCM10009706_34140 [Curtobacterium citreum]|uniref:Uncharacterized protein n=1 Tax=Curtobacterium citreum TaxID=2036 RepID=A0ABT2HM17_9MICO|nr:MULTISPECIES: hypothetical protein [Curtobacterium]MCS6524298.1 hypothetical protein [Curtobacterium citreum]QKS13248.1 hypothetical protein HUN60_08940 [Curtobacterium sp. csp3]RDH94746.1 hypothetical protein DEU32_1186 [Curtobacterium sp. AG1037]TQJ27018.1 hypothetical protein FB462_0864 [Curtobacterium citreum]GGL92816.1 hypothetical protein GCM10009706_34140 [Curtobacterium citreum]